MDHTNSTLLPHILDSLSQKPKLCDTLENLCGEINLILSSENLKRRYGNVEKAIENALEFGQSLGVITLKDDLVRLKFKKRAPKKPALTDESEIFAIQPRRTHTVRTNKSAPKKPALTDEWEIFAIQPRRTHTARTYRIPHDRSRRRRSRSRRRRRGSRRRSRSRRR